MVSANGFQPKLFKCALPLCVGACLLSLQCLAEEPQAQSPALGSSQTQKAAAPQPADEPQLQKNHPDSYTVQKGDTLWSIASRFLTKPWMWPKIWHANTEIANPNLIYAGDTIKLNYVDGKAQLTVTRGEAGRTVKLSPGAGAGGYGQKLEPRVRTEPLSNPIPAIPLEAISAFLTGDRILKVGVLDSAPYMVGGSQNHITAGAGDVFYARGHIDKAMPAYRVYRKGKTYRDEKTGEVLGEQAIDIGTVKVEKIEDHNMVRLSVMRSTQEVLPGDRLLPTEEHSVESVFYPSALPKEINAEIIDVASGVNNVGPMSVVVLNKGLRDGLQVGNILAIYQKGGKAKDPVTGDWITLPNERAGLLMAFNLFEKTCYALVLTADRALSVGDVLKNP